MKAIVNWQNNMTFIGKSASGFPVQMDQTPLTVGQTAACARWK